MATNKTNRNTQNRRIMTALRAGKTVTTSQAAAEFGVRNLRARVDELRQNGELIFTDPKGGYFLGGATKEFIAAVYNTQRGGLLFRRKRTK